MDNTGRLIGGRYRIIAPLGEGGMATIWRAVDEQLDREVAVKLLREQYGADPAFAARFRQEARSAAALSHPNIVSVYDYGTEGSNQFIVMELVDGRDLASLLQEHGPLPLDDAARIAALVASALEAAHRRGIVHRDVKPGNILLDHDARVKVTDFGIARAVSEASMTVTGTTLGSVHYFSPEQARGDDVTGSSDVYALGIVLYEMLTGRRPFEGDSAAGVALRRLSEDPPPPTVHGRALPAALTAIVMRALQREPERRFPDAGAFAEALRAWRRDPNTLPAAVLPPAGEPTRYVPPAVAPARSGAPRGTPPPPRRVAPRPANRGLPWWTWPLALLAFVLLATVGFLGAQIIGGLGPRATPGPTPIPEVAVPNWEGRPIGFVRQDAERLGLRIEEEPPEPSDTVEQGLVISTDPPPGRVIEQGSTVRVVVSSGREEVAVPPLRGQTRAEAIRSLEEARLRLGNVTSEPDPQAAETVLRSFPTAGTLVPSGSTVDLVLSSGPPPTPPPTPVPPPPPTPEATPTPEVTPSPTPEE